jgi:hypothetical protein
MSDVPVAVFRLDSISETGEFQVGIQEGYSPQQVKFVMGKLDRSALFVGLWHRVYIKEGGQYLVLHSPTEHEPPSLQ